MTRHTRHILDLSTQSSRAAVPFNVTIPGNDRAPDGTTIGFTSQGLTIDGRPRVMVAGEFHYSRMDAARWDEELAAMAAGGITVVSTYVFWNHHEEHEGEWNFTGRRNLRHFIELCARHGLYVIVRLGPFDHGEVRNGGMPDWLFSKPYDVRCMDPDFLAQTRKLYAHIAEQLEGLYFKDGGPIIAAQLDNEFQHSSALWDETVATTQELIGAAGGNEYILALRRLALECGIAVPCFTATAWGGAIAPEGTLPVWAGYAYCPWEVNERTPVPPPTDEFLYRDYTSPDCPRTFLYNPRYDPSVTPYVACEMGGGMNCSYGYRFQVDPRSVDAMANARLGSGCNAPGYYMFQGGSNPLGDGIYLNDGACPRISYDYQAPLGEYGQVRASYGRLRTLHQFAEAFGERLCGMPVALPEGQDRLDPADTAPLRWTVRYDAGTESGFVFLNTFQDHAMLTPRHDECIDLTLCGGRRVTFDRIDLAAGENCVLPFGLDLDGVRIEAATVQPVTLIGDRGDPEGRTVVLMVPDGMTRPWVRFAPDTVCALPKEKDGRVPLDAAIDGESVVVRCGEDGIRLLVVSRARAGRMLVAPGRRGLIFTGEQDAAWVRDGVLTVRTIDPDAQPEWYAAGQSRLLRQFDTQADTQADTLTVPSAVGTPVVRQTAATRWAITLPGDAALGYLPDGVDDVLLRIRYRGDVGRLWAGSTLLSDNYANGVPWEVGLKEQGELLNACGGVLTLSVAPLMPGSPVVMEKPFDGAGDGPIADLTDVELVPVWVRTFDLADRDCTESDGEI